jgi:hypothetical protein
MLAFAESAMKLSQPCTAVTHADFASRRDHGLACGTFLCPK